MRSDYAPPLSNEAWFWEGHHPGVHIWAPPPAAALMVLSQLSLARQKRPGTTTHIFVCPRLLWQEEWRAWFEKEVDVWFILHPGLAWYHDLFEPLLIGIAFPLSRNRPWLVRQLREEVVEVGRALSETSKTCHIQVGNYLRQLWLRPRDLPCLPGRLVHWLLHPALL